MRPSERLSATFLLALSAATAACAPSAGRLLLLGALLGASWLLARSRAAGGPLGLARDVVAPVVTVVACFAVLEPIIVAVNPLRLDQLLAAADARWFGSLVEVWQQALGRPAWLTDAAYLVYVSFYLLPVAVFLLGRARGTQAAEPAAFRLLLGFYLSYLGYLAWPAAGPRLTAAAEAGLGGGAMSAAVRWFLRHAEATTLDAFPSGHAGLAILAALLGARLAPRLAAVLWAWAVAIVFSTVYVHVHYVSDLLAGAVLAVLVILVAPWLERALGARTSG